MRWLSTLGLLALFASSPSFAQSKAVKKAEKMLSKFEDGKPTALTKAWEVLADARTAPDTRDDPELWVLVAETAYRYEADPDLDSPIPEPWDTTWKAWDTAIGKGAAEPFADRLLTGLMTMESIANAEATNAYEAGRLDEAWTQLDRVVRCQDLVRQVGRVDPMRELATFKLGLVVATQLGKLDEARELHTALDEAGGRKTGITLTLAHAIEESEGVAAAEAFLAPYAKKKASDAAMFETWLGYLMEVGRTDDVRVLLEANQADVGKAPKITLIHAQSWAALRDLERAQQVYEQALKVDGHNQQVLRGYAELTLARGRDFAAQASEAKKWKERKALRTQRDEAFMRGMSLLQASRELEPGHLQTLQRLREVYEEIELDDPDEIAALDEAIREAEEAAKSAE